MGILNLTPDSFSDGGRWKGPNAVKHALAMLDEGADIIDIGGESTRPGAAQVSADMEIARVMPVVAGLRSRTDAPISIDTMKPEVAQAAMIAGANIWNDVAGLTAPGALEKAAGMKAPVILMHMQGDPRTMQAAPSYSDVVAEVIAYLKERVAAARKAGVENIIVDPGIGFGKKLEHNLALLAATDRIAEEVKAPVLVGASRKSFIGKIDGSDASDRLGGSIAAALAAAQLGASFVRVHDVQETAQAIRVWRAMQG